MFTYEQIRQMNDLEIMIYNYVVSHGEEVAGMTIRELAQQLHVSATTILRFCGKVGCEGYSEFKYRLRAFLKEKQTADTEMDYTFIQDFFSRVQDSDLNDSIRRVAQIIYRKERVFFIGMGTSGTLGKYGARYLSNLGKSAFYLDDPFHPTENGNYDDTVVVALSVSGEQRFLYKQIDGLKKGKATIVSITNTKQCTLAGISDYNIAYYIPMRVLPGGYNVTSSIPVVYILEKLAHEIHRLLEEQEG